MFDDTVSNRVKLDLVLTFQVVEVTQVLQHGLDTCTIGLAPALMSSSAAASLIVDVVWPCWDMLLPSAIH